MGDSDPRSFYEKLTTMVPADHYVFMNHGYFDETEGEPAVHEGFHPVHRYSVAFIEFLFRGIELEGKDLLEIGTGRGGNLSYAVKYGGVRSATGVDLSDGNIRFCQRVHSLPNMTFVQSSADDLPFDDASFDVALNLESSHSYPDVPKFFAEALRVVRPGGTFLYADNIFEDRIEHYRNAVETSGFEIVSYQEITPKVERAMKANREPLEAYLKSMIDPELDNEAFVLRLINGFNVRVYEMYRDRHAIFGFWHLKKPE
ncbi:class I SAM-dependent methyltransferase [Paraliomyxa miuraensis]|uniref:class I SAM-dependent methyltransferase n=1 Tax=Paraliomyxa miuraensis TaxID=376150 RepID=UPI00224ECB61|nr:class I SAM-dependent methyltransferase [Paraliomyxa miuraensis]MCX4246640.1 class I SAM-dependent methyltransferase [Paraliomyxa miuraensis]